MTGPGYLGLGSNVGDRRAHLEAAVAALPAHGVTVVASSSVYETEPVGLVLDQREFFNACLAIETEHGPEELLDACKEVERCSAASPAGRATGRGRSTSTCCCSDALEYASERLTLPHPRGDLEAVRARAAARARPGAGAARRRGGWPRRSTRCGEGQEVRRAGDAAGLVFRRCCW